MIKNLQQKIEVLSNFQGVFFDEALKKYLYKQYKIVTKNVGIDKSTKTMKEFIIQPFLIDEFSLAFLAEKEPDLISQSQNQQKFRQNLKIIHSSLEYKAFKFLKQEYFLISGHKFGCSFLAYEKNPQKNHAKALIFCGTQDQMTENFNHMTRLSQIAKKQCHFIYFNQQTQELSIKVLERQTNGNTKKQHKDKKLASKNLDKS